MLNLGKKFSKTETSIFTTMSELAIKEKAINLSQGFPDFDGPNFIREKAIWAMQNGFNQYANSTGLPMMREAVSEHFKKFYQIEFDSKNEVTIYSGATEALFVAFTILVEKGDECIVFDPVYDSYAPVIHLFGGIVKSIPIELPSFEIDFEKLASLFNKKTKLLALNSPQNPTGKVFSVEELKKIAELCIKWNVIAVCDEVYEHLIFDEAKHIPLATVEGMRDRTVTISSTGKTFSYTGWKIGFSVACEEITQRLRACHQFVTFSTSTPFQVAMSEALKVENEFYDKFQSAYLEKRNLLFEILQNARFKPILPQGTYFILADYSNFSEEDDFTFAQRLTREAKVASIPVSVFYNDKTSSQNLLRFCFCKGNETLEEAGKNLMNFSKR